MRHYAMEKKKQKHISAEAILATYIKTQMPDDELITMFNLSKTCLLLQLDKYNQIEQACINEFEKIKASYISKNKQKQDIEEPTN